MALNQKFDGPVNDSRSAPVPTGTVAGTPVIIGLLPGTTRTNEGSLDVIGAGQTTSFSGNPAGFATVDFAGEYAQPVAGAVKVGQAIYLTGTADSNGVIVGTLTATATSNTLWGEAMEAKGSGTATIRVRPARV